MTSSPPEKRKRRKPRRITPTYLERAGLAYLERYAASSAHFRTVMLRKVARSAREQGTSVEEGAEMVDALIARFRKAGLLDDVAYASARARSLFRAGRPRPFIVRALRAKGLGADDIDLALQALTDELDYSDIAAAATYVKRRRIGPYRHDKARAENRQRDLAALGRSGFSFGVARAAVDAADPDALADLVNDADRRD